jgi:hypothetical protein
MRDPFQGIGKPEPLKFLGYGKELEIYVTNKDGAVKRKNIHRSRSMLTQITSLDNQVQDSCETEYEKSHFHFKKFMLYLVRICIATLRTNFISYFLQNMLLNFPVPS